MAHTDTGTDDDHSGVLDQFRWSLQALACDADTQSWLFPDFVAKAEELAEDYDHWSGVARSFFAGTFSEDQLASLRAIDDRLGAMSLGGAEFEEALWFEEALTSSPRWEEVRALGRVALDRLGWPEGKPPWGRSLYVSGRSGSCGSVARSDQAGDYADPAPDARPGPIDGDGSRSTSSVVSRDE